MMLSNLNAILQYLTTLLECICYFCAKEYGFNCITTLADLFNSVNVLLCKHKSCEPMAIPATP